jgi:small conductance mechanosensitive channel
MDQITPPDIDFEFVGFWLITSGLKVLLIIILSFVASRLLGMLTSYLGRRIKQLDDVDGSELDKRTETIFSIVHNSGVGIILITAILMILDELTIDITPVLASVGVVGLALGLGAQTLVKDIIGGIFILVEGHYRVGDLVELEGKTGTVEAMTLRVTCVRDFQGDLHIIPNGDIRLVTNKGRDWSRAIVDVSIVYEEDIDRAITALDEIGRRASEDSEIGRVMLEAPTVTGVEGLENGEIRLRLIVKTIANEQWEVQRFLRRRVQEQFAKTGIRLALPRRQVLMVDGSAEEPERDEP